MMASQAEEARGGAGRGTGEGSSAMICLKAGEDEAKACGAPTSVLVTPQLQQFDTVKTRPNS